MKLPLHLADPSKSVFCILTNDEYLNKSTEDILRLLAHRNIVITGMLVKRKEFDVETLQTLTTMNTVVPIQGKQVDAYYLMIYCFSFTFSDQSVGQDPAKHSYDNRVKQGTLQQLLRCAKQNHGEGGKILNALHFPMPEEGLGHHLFSTDSVAWRATKGRRESADGELPPLADIRWGLAATTGAVHWWHIDSDGFGTYLDVITGHKWWIIAKQKDKAPTFGSTTLFLGEYQLEEPNTDLWDIEAILLQPGMRLYDLFFGL